MEKRFVWVVECRRKGFYPKLEQPLYAFSTKKKAIAWLKMIKIVNERVNCKIVKYIPLTNQHNKKD